MQDERDLVKRAKEGDQKAFARLYEAHFDRVYRYIVIRIGDKTEAEDMTQQVFLNALRSISSFNWKGTPVAAWLFRIAHNQVVDYLRKKGKQAVTAYEDALISHDNSLQLAAEHSLDIKQLQMATRRLTPAQQEVITLRFVSELSIAEVAKVMGKTQGAIKALQHSAIVALRKVLAAGNNNE